MTKYSHTTREYTGVVSGPGKLKVPHTIPAGAKVELIDDGATAGDYWLSDTYLVKGFDNHDAVHYGFIIPKEFVA